MKSFVIIFMCCLSISEISSAKFPSYIKVCKRNSETFKCIKENIERCKPFLSKGIPRLAIPPLGPFVIPSLQIAGNNLEINLKDLKTHNLASLELVGGAIDFENFKLSLKIYVPWVFSEFNYEANGKVLIVSFNGKGTGNVNATDIHMNIDAKGHPVTKNGKEYLGLDSIDVDYKSESGVFHIDNLFANQDDLNAQTNKLINDNFREFEDEISPDIAKSISELIKLIATTIFSKFTYDELFPLE